MTPEAKGVTLWVADIIGCIGGRRQGDSRLLRKDDGSSVAETTDQSAMQSDVLGAAQ
jgi:hypothetical protein